MFMDALDNIDRFAKVVRLRINASKTKAMSTQPRSGTQQSINLGGVLLEEVESLNYLGSSLTAIGHVKGESAEGLALCAVPLPA